jgi:MFS family permease
MSINLQAPRTNTSTVDRSKLRAWLVSVMLVLLALVNWGDKAVLGLSAVPLMKDLGISNSEYGLLSSAIYFLFSASAVGAGFLANRRSIKWLLLIMVGLWSLTQFSIWLAPTFVLILLSRIVLGVAEGPSAGLSFHAASKWFRDHERNLPVAVQNVGSFGGIAVAAPALTWIITNYSWHWAFFAVGVAGLVWMVVWYFIGKDGPYSGTSEGADPETSVFDGSVRTSYRNLLLSRTFIGTVCVGLAAYWALAIVSAWLPAYLQKANGYSATSAANIVMAVSLTAIFFLIIEAFVTQKLMNHGVKSRFARGWMSAGSVMISGVFILITATMAPGMAQNVALCVGFGLGLVTFTTGAVLVSEFVPVLQRGAVLGIYVAVLTLSGIVSPTIFGAIIDAFGHNAEAGYSTAFVVSGSIVLICGIAGFLLIHPERDAAKIALRLEPADAEPSPQK